jgi:hypothetical protein
MSNGTNLPYKGRKISEVPLPRQGDFAGLGVALGVRGWGLGVRYEEV